MDVEKISMTTSARLSEARANGREAIGVLRAKAQEFTETNLPKAAEAAEHIGQTISDFAIASSKSLAQTLRENRTGEVLSKASAQAVPLLRTVGHFARRNPALLAGAGVAVALIGYAGWRWSQRPDTDTDAKKPARARQTKPRAKQTK
jgi:hypothetical protein